MSDKIKCPQCQSMANKQTIATLLWLICDTCGYKTTINNLNNLKKSDATKIFTIQK
jgi:ribosomal protein L37AE/L43A